jgi:uncharacterized surface protein with fasciclin (FAS1) repeats
LLRHQDSFVCNAQILNKEILKMKNRMMTLIVVIAMLASAGAVLAQATKPQHHRHAMGMKGMHERTVYGVMMRDSSLALNKFAREVDKAGMKNMLNGKGTCTVFAPNDAAMSQMTGKESATKIVKCAVVSGKAYTMADLKAMNGQTLTADDGSKLPIQVSGDKVMVGNALIVDADHATSNGEIQVMGSVIMPGNMMGAGSSMSAPMPMGMSPADSGGMSKSMPSGK